MDLRELSDSDAYRSLMEACGPAVTSTCAKLMEVMERLVADEVLSCFVATLPTMTLEASKRLRPTYGP
jgi:hypothetical protein